MFDEISTEIAKCSKDKERSAGTCRLRHAIPLSSPSPLTRLRRDSSLPRPPLLELITSVDGGEGRSSAVLRFSRRGRSQKGREREAGRARRRRRDADRRNRQLLPALGPVREGMLFPQHLRFCFRLAGAVYARGVGFHEHEGSELALLHLRLLPWRACQFQQMRCGPHVFGCCEGVQAVSVRRGLYRFLRGGRGSVWC